MSQHSDPFEDGFNPNDHDPTPDPDNTPNNDENRPRDAEAGSKNPSPPNAEPADSKLSQSRASSDAANYERRDGHQSLDSNVRDLLARLGLANCAVETSLCITALSKRVAPEAFEATLSELVQVMPLWRRLVETRPGRRITRHYLDEVVWITKNLRCQHATPDKVAEYLGPGSAMDVGAVLAKRLQN